ncbi:ANTAR domain-containing protein [Hoyosella rhizosphaerae]|uniref:ANTAR domain-containing protein n=1 Tax=Hoyosella rhizosphaerae TaxID=1755582 RepID=A0A916U325_9ACTN|nr:ANTAR domain-containing protein [Hoyosella rhizosphaerae]MBN4926954.1 ANTAR domain-containing protein [Hoyosella rhizosphaerae]GGC55195.1 hypothetical protein GCM10011410_04490 [Hoyosella rhizosphaerae]
MVGRSALERAHESAFRCAEVEYSRKNTSTGCVLIDRDFRIRGFNEAYEAATGLSRGEMQDHLLFDLFPDSPDNSENQVDRVRGSYERVLRCRRSNTLWVQRYDIPDPATPGGFIQKVWTLNHQPLVGNDGTVIGVVQHAEDITALDCVLASLARTLSVAEADDDHWWDVVRQLGTVGRALPRYRETYLALAQENNQLREAQASRAVIEQAKGILMGQHHCSPDEAFQILRQMSQATNEKLRDVAAALVKENAGLRSA